MVDRHLLLEPFTVDVTLQNPDTGVIEGIRRVPEAAGILGNWGAEVNDPPRFSSRVNPRARSATYWLRAPRRNASRRRRPERGPSVTGPGALRTHLLTGRPAPAAVRHSTPARAAAHATAC